MEFHMSGNLTFASAGGFLRRTRFVFVNDRVPHAEAHCAMCGQKIDKGYVRELQTRQVFCDTQCFAGYAIWRCSLSNPVQGKCHEMLKSCLQSRHWPRFSPARLVQQATVLFNAAAEG
jgi:hypothetical protein